MSPTMPKEGPLEEANRSRRREVRWGRADGLFGVRAFVGIVSKPERLACSRVAAARRRAYEASGKFPRYAHPQARRVARLGRQMEASRIAHELYPVIDRARGL